MLVDESRHHQQSGAVANVKGTDAEGGVDGSSHVHYSLATHEDVLPAKMLGGIDIAVFKELKHRGSTSFLGRHLQCPGFC